jgi:hypothetical protein
MSPSPIKKKAASELDEREFIQSRMTFKKSPVKDQTTQYEKPCQVEEPKEPDYIVVTKDAQVG